jgi:putative membrane protein
MQLIGNIAVALVAALHVWILVLEMFLWTRPTGLKAFRNTPEKARDTAVLAANQGLYNGFLAAGLVFGLLYPALVAGGEPAALHIKSFFLLCVAVAGLYGAATAAKKILYIQTVPAVIALALVWGS